MKSTFLLFCVILWQLLTSSMSIAQTQIDSAIIELNDIRCSDQWRFHHDGFEDSYGNRHEIFTKRYFVYGSHNIISGDSMNIGSSITMVFDSVTNVIRNFKYHTESHQFYFNEEVNFGFQEALGSTTAGSYLFKLDSTALSTAGFTFTWSSDGVAGPGNARTYDQYYYEGLISTSSMQMQVYYHTPASGVQQHSNEDFPSFAYPNPARNLLTIDLPIGNSPMIVTLSDLLGRERICTSIVRTDNAIQLDISSFSPGIYYLHAGNQVQKIVIQR